MVLNNYQAISEAIKAGKKGILCIRKGKNSPRIQEILAKASSGHIQVKYLSDREMLSMAGDGNRGLAFQLIDPISSASSRAKKPLATEGLDFPGCLTQLQDLGSALIVFLDGITDPHNLGAILRSADIFAADAVVIPGRRTAGINSTVVEVSSGAAHYVPVFQVTNLNRALQESQENGFWIYGADMGGSAASSLKLNGKVGLVLGSEGKGLHQRTSELCDQIISIPMKGHVDSLNVSVAAGILMYEVRRQQGWS